MKTPRRVTPNRTNDTTVDNTIRDDDSHLDNARVHDMERENRHDEYILNVLNLLLAERPRPE